MLSSTQRITRIIKGYVIIQIVIIIGLNKEMWLWIININSKIDGNSLKNLWIMW